MRAVIDRELAGIEEERNVRILYACESGSRAWGFASANSDWDVRFIYAHPRDWYLSICDHRDVIEAMLPGDLDLSGWDIRKALRLFRKSNPPLYEWLRSPIVYRTDREFVSALDRLAARYWSPRAMFKHYLSMAAGNIRNYFGDDEVRMKKYLYVLRPLLACRWIEQERGPVPMEFEKAFVTIDDASVVRAIEDLVNKKRSGAELDRGRPDPILRAFVDSEFPRLQSLNIEAESLAPLDPLDELFRNTIKDH